MTPPKHLYLFAPENDMALAFGGKYYTPTPIAQAIARDLSLKYAIPARKSASLMDTASCIVQGYLPYGAQLLMAAGLAAISPVEIIPHLYYPFLIGCMVVISIIFKFPRR